MASEEAVSNSADLAGSSLGENGEPGNGVSFRIRDVHEINSTVQVENNNAENGKRRLPNWLASPVEERKEKRSRINKLVANGEGSSAENEASASEAADGADICSTSDSAAANKTNVGTAREIKVECAESNTVEDAEAMPANEEDMDTNEACATSSGDDQVDKKLIKTEVKDETSEEAASSSVGTSNTDTKRNVVKQEATSTKRDSCKYGIRCYRRNPAHRAELAHPGDSDYRRPDYPSPPKGTPDCPYGDRCYRRNPTHFQEYSHPPSTDFKKNWQERQKRLRKPKKDSQYEYYDDDEEDESEEDPFETDGSNDEYIPSDDE